MKEGHVEVLMPDHFLYAGAIEELKLYHIAQANGVLGMELERLRFGSKTMRLSLLGNLSVS